MRRDEKMPSAFRIDRNERPGDTLRRLEKIVPPGDSALANLREIVSLVETAAPACHIRVDPSLARGLSYYTGAIMEAAVPDLAGSLGGGGRYDNLIGMFLGRDVPACGFSLGLERIIVVMTERNMFPDSVEHGAPDVMVTFWNDRVPGGRARPGGGPEAGGLARRGLSGLGQARQTIQIRLGSERAVRRNCGRRRAEPG